MVDTPYQRKGIGRMITRKCNEIADVANKATYVKARPSSKLLFEQEGYRVLEEIAMNYEEFGYEGKSAVFVMKREPGGKEAGEPDGIGCGRI
jgi:ribosome biogenesis protein Nip4